MISTVVGVSTVPVAPRTKVLRQIRQAQTLRAELYQDPVILGQWSKIKASGTTSYGFRCGQ